MYDLFWHKNLNQEKWNKFSISKQILMIGNELNRALNLAKEKENEKENEGEIKFCLERAMELTDLTVNGSENNNFRRELLRWRDCLAEVYNYFDQQVLKKILEVLLTLNSEAYALLNF